MAGSKRVTLKLLTGPAGSGKTHRALGRIRDAATTPGPYGAGTARADEALLVLPTYAQVNHIKRRALSRWEVRGIFDRPFTTFTAAGERFLDSFRVGGLPSPEERDRLMEEALRQRDPDVFRAIADRPGFRAHLLRLVKELKQTGLEGGEAREHLAAARDEVGFASRRKLAAFLDTFEAYEDLLEHAGLEDHEDALRRLAKRLETEPLAATPRVLVVDGFDDFSRVEERILEALSTSVAEAGGEVLVTLPWDAGREHLFATSRGARRRLLARGFVEEPLRGFQRATAPPLSAIATHLFGHGAPALPGGDTVQSIVAGDGEDEAESVARAVRSLGGPDGFAEGLRGWRDVGIVVRQLTAYAPRLEGAFARLGVPLRVVGRGSDLASEPILRALRGPLQVLAGATGEDETAFDGSGLVEWLRWRALLGGDPPSAVVVDAWDLGLRTDGFPATFESMVTTAPKRLAPWFEALQHQVSTLTAIALDPTTGAPALYDALAAALEALAPVPDPAGFDADGRPLDAVHDTRLARAIAARARAVSILVSLREAAVRTGIGGATDARGAVQELIDALEQTSFRAADRRLDAVTLMDAEEARFWELPVTVVAGLEEGGFPLRPREDVLLRDDDREALRAKDPALRLPLARDREARERRLFYGAVTRASKRLLLARRAYDDKGDPREPSAFLTELETVVVPTPLSRALRPGRVVRPLEECFTVQDLRLYAAGRLGPWAQRRADVTEAERTLAAALQSASKSAAPARVARARLRAADPLGYDEATRTQALAVFAAATSEVSVSRLNHGVLCPHRFFLAYVARIPQDDFTLDGPVFDNRQRGTALHHAFEEAIRHPDRSPERLARDAVAHVHAEGLNARLLAFEIERAVALLRDRESRSRGVLQPWIEGLELEFRGEKAVEIGPDDCRFRLGGAMDRIDRGTPPGGRAREIATIMDYKRSAGSVESYAKRGTAGQDLQLPLYARALEAMEGVDVVGFEWVAGLTRARRIIHDEDALPYFEARREANALKTEPHDEFRARIDAAEATAAEVVRTARGGGHERRPIEAGTCKECYWKDICRPDIPYLDEQARARVAGDDVAASAPSASDNLGGQA